MEILSNSGGALCEVVFGGGTTEFKPGSWASSESAGDDSIGPIQYRIEGKQVPALPDQGVLLTVQDSTGYQCPHGPQPVVIECNDNTDGSGCGVGYIGSPMPNGFQMRGSVVSAAAARCGSSRR